MWNPFHKHDFPTANSIKREAYVGDDWTCTCGKNFFVFTYKYDKDGNELLEWREAGKFK